MSAETGSAPSLFRSRGYLFLVGLTIVAVALTGAATTALQNSLFSLGYGALMVLTLAAILFPLNLELLRWLSLRFPSSRERSEQTDPQSALPILAILVLIWVGLAGERLMAETYVKPKLAVVQLERTECSKISSGKVKATSRAPTDSEGSWCFWLKGEVNGESLIESNAWNVLTFSPNMFGPDLGIGGSVRATRASYSSAIFGPGAYFKIIRESPKL